jgi:hypothetical protein
VQKRAGTILSQDAGVRARLVKETKPDAPLWYRIVVEAAAI